MGEFARYGKSRIKIGTCENMYYLRADQASLVQPESSSLNPADEDIQKHIRFRFPWPDEDGIAPGAFDKDFDRGLYLHRFKVPMEVEHGSIQFHHDAGYLVSLPCPELDPYPLAGVDIGRNGFPGGVQIVQQAYREGQLATVLKCNCGARFWADSETADQIAGELQREAENAVFNKQPDRARFLTTVKERVLAGYARKAA